MSEKVFNTRVVHKHDTEENWNKAINFIPKQSELIVYDIDSSHTKPRIKIGDGSTNVINLPFYVEVDSALNATSSNPVENQAINTALNNKQATPFTGNTSSITPNQVYNAIFTDKKDVIINCFDATFGFLIFTSFEIHPPTNIIFSSAVRIVDGKPTLYLLVGNMGHNTWTTSSYVLATSDNIPTVDSELSDTSENPVQNKVIKAYIDSIAISDIDSIRNNATNGQTAYEMLNGVEALLSNI